MIRIALFCTLLIAGLTLPWPVFFCAAFAYALWCEGNELVVLGFLFDAYFSYTGSALPLNAAYSIALTGMLVCVWGLKPLLMIDRNETFA